MDPDPKTTFEYHVIAELGVEDDMECSLAHWLEQSLKSKGELNDDGILVILDSTRKEVDDWAMKEFDQRPAYYVAITEIRRREDRQIAICHDAYRSPSIRNRDPSDDIPALRQDGSTMHTAVAYVKDLRREIKSLIPKDRWKKLLQTRSEAREKRSE